MVDADWNEAGLLEVKGLAGCNASNQRSECNLAQARDLTPIRLLLANHSVECPFLQFLRLPYTVLIFLNPPGTSL